LRRLNTVETYASNRMRVQQNELLSFLSFSAIGWNAGAVG